ISGRPISFQMNLYDALFIKRPVVEPELFASLRPPTYSGAIDARLEELKAIRKQQERVRAQTESLLGGRRKAADALEQQDKAVKDLKEEKKSLEEETFRELDQKMELGKSVSSAASASKLGDYFQYAIDHPVTLPRQKSALLPIVGKEVDGQRVSIFNERTHAKFPLLGLIFKNTSGMHLTQGPITVYEGSTYAGDARILDLQKDERRLLSYAIDLGTEIQAVPHSDNGRLTSVKVVKGILHTTTKIKESRTYTIVNRNDMDRTLLIEHPNRTDFHLTSKDKPWETAADFHRFQVSVPAGKTVPYTIS